MVLYRVHVCGSRIKNIAAPLPAFCALVGWDDEGGDPVFVAVLPPKATPWSPRHKAENVAAAFEAMKDFINHVPGEPDYYFPDIS